MEKRAIDSNNKADEALQIERRNFSVIVGLEMGEGVHTNGISVL